MAILSGVPGLEVTIQSFEEDLPEYEDDGAWTQGQYAHLYESTRSQNFVECKTDAEFRIRLNLKHPFKMSSQSLAFKAHVDGHGIAQATCTMDYFARCSGYYMEMISSRLDRISPTQLSSRALKFSSLTKVDDADSSRVKKDAKALVGIGEIVVTVHRAVQKENYLPRPGNAPGLIHTPPTEVAEKALKGKAISHGVSYGEQQIVNRSGTETIDVDGPRNPIGVFVFKYRSRADLQAELIIPRSPSPEPIPAIPVAHRIGSGSVPVDRDVRLAQLKKEMADIKAEEEEEGSARGQKRGSDASFIGSGRAFKTSRGDDGKLIIDLTDD